MKGLLLKEIGIMKTQKVFFLIIAAMVIFAAFSSDLSFALGYLSLAMPIFAITTISYDEFDNGYAFLFTLPISRKQYVMEKYLLGLILGGVAMALSVTLALICGIFGDMSASIEAVKALPAILAIMLIILSVIIPIQIKFGAEKGRNAMLVLTGAAVAIGFGIGKFLKADTLLNALNKLQQIDAWILIAAGILITVIVLLLSIKISISVINKKEF